LTIWKAIKGQKVKQPYATAKKEGSPVGIAGLWENLKDPNGGVDQDIQAY
jgi:putative SOS response-associated peptidase YedK